MRILRFSSIAAAIFLSSLMAFADETISSQAARFKVQTVVEGLENPWAMEKLPDGRFLVTERPGRLRIITADGKLQEAPVENLPEVKAEGQGGLLDVRLHPQHAENGWIYLAYSKPLGEGSLTSIIRAKLEGNALTNIETIFDPKEDQTGTGGAHFGCRIDFDGNGHVFFAIGDRGIKENAQMTENVKGKSHRLHEDGRAPQDNPHANGSAPSIWTIGNRNIQGMRIQPGTGLLWACEHGPRGGDELNILRKGNNYGWPDVTYGINYDGSKISEKTEQEGIEPPVVQWTPSPGVCGMDFYTGEKFPKWKGNLFVAALAQQNLIRVVIEGEKVTHQERLLDKSGRVRDVRSFDDGFLYVIYDQPGKIVRLVPE